MAKSCLIKLPLLFSIFSILFSITFSTSETEALLQFKNSLQNVDALQSWVADSSPCLGESHWAGMICYEGIVTGLRLEGMGLSGKIDVEALRKLPLLRSISIMDNNFTGSAPEFNRLGVLKAIYLSGNQFSGEIPADYFAKMESMKKVWLSNNQFTGKIPSSLANLRHLLELCLENNQFTGEIPSLKTPPLVSLNVSNNRLVGPIPASLSKFNPNSFGGNAELCGGIVGKECDHDQAPSEPPESPGADETPSKAPKEGSNVKKIVGTVATVCVVIFFIAVLIVFVTRPKRERDELVDGVGKRDIDEVKREIKVEVATAPILDRKESSSISSRRSSSSKRGSSHGKGGGDGGGIGDLVIVNDRKGAFGLADLMKAAAEVLGNGGIGSAYKAVLAKGIAVAVKRMKEMNKVGKEVFDEEMRKLAGLKHWNILPPLAYHYRKEEKLVIYEYIPRGSLLYLLHGDRGPSPPELNWPTRLKIIQGITQGMAYLHSKLSSYDLPHGNLKSSNILIGEDNSPLISEYGFSSLINTNHLTQGLFAYRSPEVLQNQASVSPKSDVYCLGIVILEILTRKFPSQYLIASNKSGGIDVVQWVASAIAENREAKLLDPEIANCENAKDAMVQFLRIGVTCAEANPRIRPDMKEVFRRVEEIAELNPNNHEAKTIHLLPSLRDGIC
ncbi:hypothetical protein Drorol1_Dr00007669 [Drosera rotundifolia]